MMRAPRYQLAVTVAAVVAMLLVRLTQFPGGSPFELFLLLNILVATLFKPPAALTSVVAGIVGSHIVMALEGRVPRRYATVVLVYLGFSGVFLFLNHRGHSSRDRLES